MLVGLGLFFAVPGTVLLLLGFAIALARAAKAGDEQPRPEVER